MDKIWQKCELYKQEALYFVFNITVSLFQYETMSPALKGLNIGLEIHPYHHLDLPHRTPGLDFLQEQRPKRQSRWNLVIYSAEPNRLRSYDKQDWTLHRGCSNRRLWSISTVGRYACQLLGLTVGMADEEHSEVVVDLQCDESLSSQPSLTTTQAYNGLQDIPVQPQWDATSSEEHSIASFATKSTLIDFDTCFEL